VNAYRDGTYDFADLLRKTSEIEGIERIRFTSPHPSEMTERAIAVMATCSKVAPYLHLPLQSPRIALRADGTRLHCGAIRRLVARFRASHPLRSVPTSSLAFLVKRRLIFVQRMSS
jgi:tRNA-2-methylthio-N6-dimethylallyladenosine synthase